MDLKLKYWLLGLIAIVLLLPIAVKHGIPPDVGELTSSVEEFGAYGGIISGGIQILIWVVSVFKWFIKALLSLKKNA
jgi:hypothetical protein